MENYKKIELVGKGNFGCAILVQSTQNRKYYIMKVIDIFRLDQRQRQDALNEVKFLKELQHPFIIAYRESFVDKDRYLCIVMDYCKSGDLHYQIIEQKKTGEGFTEQQILDWFVQICFGLKYIHDKRILHRDLKTQNIFLTSQKQIKIGDFGIAKVLQNTCEMAKTAIGTPYYLSPEICSRKPYNQKTDIWSLGCILYELTTLRHAFDAKRETLKIILFTIFFDNKKRDNINFYQILINIQDYEALVFKILKGNYPSIPNCYSSQLSELIGEMLQRQPSKRPSVKKILEKPFLASTINKLQSNYQIQLSNSKGGDVFQNDIFTAQQATSGISQNFERPLVRNDENLTPLSQQQVQYQKQQQSSSKLSSLNSSFLKQLSSQNYQQKQHSQQIVSNCDNIIQQQKLQYSQNQQDYSQKQIKQNTSNPRLITEDFRTPTQEKNFQDQYCSQDSQKLNALTEIKSQFLPFQKDQNFGQQQQLQQWVNDKKSSNGNIIKYNVVYTNINQNMSLKSISRQDSPCLRQQYKNSNQNLNQFRKSFDGVSECNSSNQIINPILPQNINDSKNSGINSLLTKSQNKIINPQYKQVGQNPSMPPIGKINYTARSSVDNLNNQQLTSSSNRKQSSEQSNQINQKIQNQRSSSLLQQQQSNQLPQIQQQSQNINQILKLEQQQSDNQMNKIQNYENKDYNSTLRNKFYNSTQRSDSDQDFEEPEDERVKFEFLGIDGKRIPDMSEKDSIFNIIEALKVYLEKNLGEDIFIEIYQELQSSDDNQSKTEQSNIINNLLNDEQQKFIPLIYQLIFCEDQYYTNM